MRAASLIRRLLPTRDSRIVAILWLALLVEAGAFALLQPVWGRVDEAQHFHFVQYLYEERQLPVEGKTLVSPEVVAVSLEAGQWGWQPAGTTSVPTHLDPEEWITIPGELERVQREQWVRRNLWHFNYEAMQPPLYYAANVPIYAALPDDSLLKLYGMRLLAVLMASAMVPIAYLTAREVYPGSRLVVLGTPAIVLLTQGYALNMSQVTNDALAVPLASAAILLMLMIARRGFDWRRSLLAGVFIGAAMLSKMTAVFLLPVLLAAVRLPMIYRDETLKRAAIHGGLVIAPAAVIMAPWVLRNLAVYGDATGAAAAEPLMSSFFMSPAIDMQTLRLEELLPTFWFGEPIYPFPLWRLVWIPLAVALIMSLVGMVYYFMYRFRDEGMGVRSGVAFLSFTFIWGVGVSLMLPFASGIGGVPGRYLYPLLPAGAFLMLFGVERLLERHRARFVAEIFLVWIVIWESINFLAYIQNR